MLPYSTLLFKMHVLFLIMIWAFMGMTVAELQCDTVTQYAVGDQCCLMCGPGTSMLPTGTCQVPQCKDCGENEYQDTYTNKSKCQRQPYCDPNKQFVTVHKGNKERNTCECKHGFHCSSKDCLTCVPHRICKPGFGANPKGGPLHDTKCEECPTGTFSNDSSWDGVCQKWTECPMGYRVQESGTDTTDNKCEKLRLHIIVIILVSVVVGVALIVGILFWLKRGCIKHRAKGYFEPQQPAEEHMPQIEILQTQTVHVPMTPEENEDDPSHELSSEGLTENGNCVMQEMGKIEIVSRQESQQESQQDSLISLQL